MARLICHFANLNCNLGQSVEKAILKLNLHNPGKVKAKISGIIFAIWAWNDFGQSKSRPEQWIKSETKAFLAKPWSFAENVWNARTFVGEAKQQSTVFDGTVTFCRTENPPRNEK